MKIIEILKWEASKKCVAKVFASAASDLADELGDLVLLPGSMAYLANGDAYILGDSWTKVGTVFPQSGGGPSPSYPNAEDNLF